MISWQNVLSLHQQQCLAPILSKFATVGNTPELFVPTVLLAAPEHLDNSYELCVDSCRRLVGLAGPPGAGKSTLASDVVRRVNKLWPQKASSFDAEVNPPDVAIVLPMDGFHLYRSQLDAMEVDLIIFS